MNISKKSQISIATALKEAVGHYQASDSQPVLTDIHLQPNPESGQLTIFNDDDEVLAIAMVEEWSFFRGKNFYDLAGEVLRGAVRDLGTEIELGSLALVKPYSFVLVDEEKETVTELMLVDDRGTLFLDDELLKGLDDELDSFIKKLLSDV